MLKENAQGVIRHYCGPLCSGLHTMVNAGSMPPFGYLVSYTRCSRDLYVRRKATGTEVEKGLPEQTLTTLLLASFPFCSLHPVAG